MRSVVVLLGLIVASSANAHDRLMPQPAQTPGHNPLECYCRAQGRMFAPGEKICLKTAEGPRLAQCVMQNNVMSWSLTYIPCPDTKKNAAKDQAAWRPCRAVISRYEGDRKLS